MFKKESSDENSSENDLKSIQITNKRKLKSKSRSKKKLGKIQKKSELTIKVAPSDSINNDHYFTEFNQLSEHKEYPELFTHCNNGIILVISL